MLHSDHINKLDQDEQNFVLYALNNIEKPGFGLDVNMKLVQSYNQNVLRFRMESLKDKVSDEGYPIYSGIMKKLFDMDIPPLVPLVTGDPIPAVSGEQFEDNNNPLDKPPIRTENKEVVPSPIEGAAFIQTMAANTGESISPIETPNISGNL